MRKLKSVDRRNANLEAEKGEVAITSLFGISIPESYIIGGKKHSEGGTPLSLPGGSFIFSDDKSLTIRDPDILRLFGEKKPKTPARIAMKYDMSGFKESFLNEDNPIKKNTAALMIQNNMYMLGKLALVQESMKGFPEGIPEVARYYMGKAGISEEDIYKTIRSEHNMGDKKYQEGGVLDHNNYVPADYISEEERRRIEGLVASGPGSSENDYKGIDYNVGENYTSPGVISEEDESFANYVAYPDQGYAGGPGSADTSYFYPGKPVGFTLRGLGTRVAEGIRTAKDFLFDRESYRDRKLRKLLGEGRGDTSSLVSHEKYIPADGGADGSDLMAGDESNSGSSEGKGMKNENIAKLPVVNINLYPGRTPYLSSMLADINRRLDYNNMKYKYLYPSADRIYVPRPLYRGDYVPSGTLYGHFGDIYRSGYGYSGGFSLLRRKEGGSVIDGGLLSEAFRSAIEDMASDKGFNLKGDYTVHSIVNVVKGDLDGFMKRVHNHLKSKIKNYDKVKDDYIRYIESRLGYNPKGDKTIQNPEEGRSDIDLAEYIQGVITGEKQPLKREDSAAIQDKILKDDVVKMHSVLEKLSNGDIKKAYIRIGNGKPVELSGDDVEELKAIAERIHDSFASGDESQKTDALIDEFNRKMYGIASGKKDSDVRDYFRNLPGSSFSKMFSIEVDVDEDGDVKRRRVYEGSGFSRRDALIGSVTLSNRFGDIERKQWLNGDAGGAEGSGRADNVKAEPSGPEEGAVGARSTESGVETTKATGTEWADSVGRKIEVPEVPGFRGVGEKAPYRWAVQDVNNLLYSLYTLNSIKKYYPFEYVPEYQIPTPRYYDPTRALQNIQQSSSDYARTLSSVRNMDPQVLAASLSSIQKDVASKSADVISQYDDRNRAVASEYERTLSNLANEYNMRRALSAQSLYDKTVKTESEYDKERRAALRNVIAAENQGIKNAADIYNLNNYVYADSPFYIDEFGVMRMADNWVSLRPSKPSDDVSGFTDIAKGYDAAIKYFTDKGYTYDEAKDLAKDIIKVHTYGKKGKDGKTTQSVYNYNPSDMLSDYKDITTAEGEEKRRLGGQTMLDSYINKILRDVKDYLKDPINEKHRNLFRRKES